MAWRRTPCSSYLVQLTIMCCCLAQLSHAVPYSGNGKTSSNGVGNQLDVQQDSSLFSTRNNTLIIVQRGGLAMLPCIIKWNPSATVSWIRRRDFQLLTVGLSTYSSDDRFLVEHTRHMGHWSLRLKSVRDEDRGLYECQLSVHPPQSIFVELKVVEAVADIVGSPDLHIDEGSTLRLECRLKRATENPAFVFWYLNQKMVNYDAQDGFSVSTSQPSALVVIAPATLPIVTADAAAAGPSASTGHHHHIDPVAAAQFDGVDTLKPTGNATNAPVTIAPQPLSTPTQPAPIPQSSNGHLRAPSTSVLIIREVHFKHAGNYTCAPSNARPTSITVHVLRSEKPAAMQHANRSSTSAMDSANDATAPTSSCRIHEWSLPIVIATLIYLVNNNILYSHPINR